MTWVPIFQQRLGKVSVLWKTLVLYQSHRKLVPVDWMTLDHAMKTLEWLVLHFLDLLVHYALNPMQFSYQDLAGAENAIIYMPTLTWINWGCCENLVVWLFQHLQHHPVPLLREKVDRDRSGYLPDILDYRLPDCRTQFVRLKAHVSEMMVSSSGASQRNMLSPVLFRLYTSDFNTAIVECLNRGQEENYRGLISNFVTWCSWTVPRPRRLGLGTSQKSSLPLLTISIEISNSINYYSRYKTSHFIFRHITRVLMSWQ